MKFIRRAELYINVSFCGVVGIISSHAFLANRTLRGMRESLLETFGSLSFLNLHGNSASGEGVALDQDDKNVFDITEGVAISVFVAAPETHEHVTCRYADLAGSRNTKYDLLARNSLATMSWTDLSPEAPNFVFKPASSIQTSFEKGFALDEIFQQRSAGVITARDDFATDNSREVLISRVEAFARSSLVGEQLRNEFGIRSKKGWDVNDAQLKALEGMPLRDHVHPYCYRPFDSRFIAYNSGIVWSRAHPTLKHMLAGQNILLIGMQQYQYDVPYYCYIFVSNSLTDSRIFVSKTGVASLFPLYLYESGINPSLGSKRIVNLGEDFIHQLLVATELNWVSKGGVNKTKTVDAEFVFAFIYAQLSAPSYHSQFAEPLKMSFPRIFLPRSSSLFWDLSHLGSELVSLHLMESPKLDCIVATFDGPRNPEVSRVGWSNGTVWLDAGKTKAREGHRATKPGTIGFYGVYEEIWDFYIGGYQVCYKWLNDRKGRTLSDDDILHFKKIVIVLDETIRIMGEIDKVINHHGGWPSAFLPPPP